MIDNKSAGCTTNACRKSDDLNCSGGCCSRFTRLRISPAARRLARELGVNPSTVKGTGRGGAIMSEGIERAKYILR